MISQQMPEHPSELHQGASYLYRHRNNGSSSYVPVIFLDYTPCPAVIIIRDEGGNCRRCAREELCNVPE